MYSKEEMDAYNRRAEAREARAKARFAKGDLVGADAYRKIHAQLEFVDELPSGIQKTGYALLDEVTVEKHKEQFPKYKIRIDDRGKNIYHKKFDKLNVLSEEIAKKWKSVWGHAHRQLMDEQEELRHLLVLIADTVTDVPKLPDRLNKIATCWLHSYSTQPAASSYARGHHKPLEERLLGMGFEVHVQYVSTRRPGERSSHCDGYYDWWSNVDPVLADAISKQITMGEALAARGTLNPMVIYGGIDCHWTSDGWKLGKYGT